MSFRGAYITKNLGNIMDVTEILRFALNDNQSFKSLYFTNELG